MQCSAPQVCTLNLLKSHRVEDAAHQTGLLFQRGKASLENSQSGDVFIVCLERSQMTTETKNAYFSV